MKTKKYKTLYDLIGKDLKEKAKASKLQSKKDKLAYKNSIKEFKANYKPTGNKEDNPAFNGYMSLKGRHSKEQNGMSARKMYRTCKRTKHKVELNVSMNTAA